MAIAITVAEVKRKAMVSTSDHDTAIEDLIDEMQPALEHSIARTYLDAVSDAGLQAALKLGMLEIVTGEFVEQLRREIGAAEEFSAAGVGVGASALRGLDLIEQGANRLAPFLASALPMMAESGCRSNSTDSAPTFSTDEEVW